MKKSLAIALLASTISAPALAAGAFAAGVGSIGSQLVQSDIRLNDGSRVGFVPGIESNRSVEVRINGETKVLREADFRIVEQSDDSYTLVVH